VRHALSLFVLLTISAVALPAASIEGDWSGVLEAGPTRLRVVLHITAGEDGSLSGTLDSIDQGQNGLTIRSIVLEGSELRFEMQGLPASYTGTVAEDGGSIAGSWTQGGASLPLNFRIAADEEGPDESQYPRLEGVWAGELAFGQQRLRTVLRVERQDDGFRVTVESPDQSPTGIPVSSLTIEGDAVEFSIGAVGASFTGTLDEAAGTITGNFSQGGGSIPLVLTKTDEVPEARRPQTPEGPFPYQVEEVTFPGGAEGVVLAGTLTLPGSGAPFPAVVLVSGSGAQDRDETILGHKPFLVLADHLTRAGIAVLRYDDRGAGASAGDFSSATTTDFASDAEAALAFLGTRDDIADNRLGVLGHSEGATAAAMVASRRDDLAFVVLLAGPAVPGEQILVSQIWKLLDFSGVDEATIESRVEQNRSIYESILEDRPPEEIREQLEQMLPPEEAERQMAAVTSPWFREFIGYDPTEALSKLKMPVLALYGENDMQVDPGVNMPALVEAQAANEWFRVEELHGMNHLFQTSETGSPGEYGAIQETMSPSVLGLIADWIHEALATAGPG